MNLIIIGNGFDIAHKIPTRLSDFYAYLKKRKPDDVKNMICCLGDNNCVRFDKTLI